MAADDGAKQKLARPPGRVGAWPRDRADRHAGQQSTLGRRMRGVERLLQDVRAPCWDGLDKVVLSKPRHGTARS